MRLMRRIAVVALSAVVLLVSTALPAAAKGGKRSRIEFTKPVGLGSSAPLRTLIGEVYSATRGGNSSDHEWSGEPSLKIDTDGVIYIAGTCCVVASSPVWRSTNNGRSFKELESPGHVREWGIGAEGDLAVDNKGRVFFIDTYIAGLLMSAWKDNGKTWEYTAQPAGPIPGFDDRPWLAISDKALYLYINHVTHTEVYRSTDGGKTWTTGGPLSYDGNATGQPFFPGHISAHRKSDTLWVAGVVDDKLASLVSKDGGTTFTQADVAVPARSGGFSPIFTGATAVDKAGNGYATWSTYDEKGCDVYYAVSTNQGKSWGKPIKVNESKGCATFPWIAAADKGKVALAYYQTPPTGKPADVNLTQTMLRDTSFYNGLELPVAPFQDEVPEKHPWYLNVALVDKAHTKKPRITEERVPHRTPVLEGPLQRELWDFLQLDIDKEGQVHIAYVDKFNDSAPQTWYVGTKTKL